MRGVVPERRPGISGPSFFGLATRRVLPLFVPSADHIDKIVSSIWEIFLLQATPDWLGRPTHFA
jgi:hypothetical protein